MTTSPNPILEDQQLEDALVEFLTTTPNLQPMSGAYLVYQDGQVYACAVGGAALLTGYILEHSDPLWTDIFAHLERQGYDDCFLRGLSYGFETGPSETGPEDGLCEHGPEEDSRCEVAYKRGSVVGHNVRVRVEATRTVVDLSDPFDDDEEEEETYSSTTPAHATAE